MSDISFVVVSTPRSGTTFAASLFSALGVHCDHEYYFNLEHAVTSDLAYDKFGEASWFAAPFLHKLPAETVILHQVRDPLKTINSLISSGAMGSGPTPWLSWDWLKRHTQFPDLNASEAELAMFFWCQWHKRIERAMGCGIRRAYFRYRVEQIEESLPFIMRLIGLRPDPALAAAALASVSTSTNSWGEYENVVARENVSAEVRELATRYGYAL